MLEQPEVFSTPVLMIIFNRYQSAKEVLQRVRQVRPAKLYIAADGPRAHVPEDFVQCAEARRIIDEVDWECEVHTLLQESNLNCSLGPVTAMNWFFDAEEMGIVLEDDCLPSRSFFHFCRELLLRYRNDTRIMHIGGRNYQFGRRYGDASYYFSDYGHVWGWASWRRAWKLNNLSLRNFAQIKNEGLFRNILHNPLQRYYYMRKFAKTVDPKTHVTWWDYQWDYSRWTNNGLAIIPKVNLVENIGFGVQATHTANPNSQAFALRAHELELPLLHPGHYIRNQQADLRYFRWMIRNAINSRISSLVSRTKAS